MLLERPAFRSRQALHLADATEVNEGSRARLKALHSISDLIVDWDQLL